MPSSEQSSQDARLPVEVALTGGEFLMGSDNHYPDEGPARRVVVGDFAIGETLVTNAQFAEFVEATDYRTFAEIPPDPAMYPGAPEENLVPGSMVFTMTEGPVDLRLFYHWWRWVPGADWRHPTGPDSSIDGLEDHPVVHVGIEDANAYANWVGGRLPTEAEWEYAARGGLDGAEFTWGDRNPQEKGPNFKANTWQGKFPYHNTELDGWLRTSPVGIYEPNGYGLYDMAGNVWEWTADFYGPQGGGVEQGGDTSPCCGSGRSGPDGVPGSVEATPQRVLKGGSYLCTDQYCFRYRPAARQSQPIDSASGHIGFRVVRDRH